MTLIKRYANRKLYNTGSSRYITLRGISELLERGEEVRVIDNESGEDITSVTLSQILVDSGRGGREPSGNLLNELFNRGGEFYETIRRVSDDASEGIEELQRSVRRIIRPQRGSEREGGDGGPDDRVRRIIRPQRGSEREGESGDDTRHENGEGAPGNSARRQSHARDWIAFGPPDFEKIMQRALERMTRVLDLPRRSDFEALRERIDRLTEQLDELRKDAGAEASASTKPRADEENGHAPTHARDEQHEPAADEPAADALAKAQHASTGRRG